MKKIMKSFREFIVKEGAKADYIDEGVINLYHYADMGYGKAPDHLIIDPDRFGQSSYSRNEKSRSSFPRSFYYVDPVQRERDVAQGKKLYKYQIPAETIYDFRKDPKGYDRLPSEEFPEGLIDPDTPTKRLYMGDDKHSWGALFRKVAEDYDGMFYSLRNFDVVVLFRPVSAQLVDPETQAELEGRRER